MKTKKIIKSLACLMAMLYLIGARHAVAQTYFAGASAGLGNTGTSVTGVGTSALRSSNSGIANAAFGSNALYSNTSGANNTALGTNSLYRNTTANYNTAVGRSALYNNITGIYNTATGYNALFANTGSYNVAYGSNALTTNTSGTQNTAAGHAALQNNTTGGYNIAIGYRSLPANTTGSRNTAVGNNSLNSNTTGNSNTALGYLALSNNSTGFANTGIGDSTLGNNQTGSLNTAVGHKALLGNSRGSGNTGIGSYSLHSNPNGYSNTAMGIYTLYSNTTGYRNTAVGDSALFSNTTGANNVAIGADALSGTGTASSSIAIGGSAMSFAGGTSNIAIGSRALWYGLNANSDNIGIGRFVGSATTLLMKRNVFLGATSGPDLTAFSDGDSLENSIALGYAALVDASNKVVIGNTAVTSIGGWANWTNFSDRRLKTNISKSKLGLDFIMSLNPVTYNYTVEGQKDILQTGLIAQEVDAAAKKAGVDFNGVDKSGEYWGIRYATLTVPLIKAMQEMEEKHTAEKEMLNSRIEKLEAAIAAMQQKPMAEKNTVQQQSILYQNQPNPFNQSTVIRYSLKTGDEKAFLIIRDLNGRALKQINLVSGKGSISISAGELAAGTYTYSLIINGECADTKLMVMAK